MNTSNPFSFAALKMRSMFSTVLFSVTLSPTNGHARPLSLKTSFCGSINTTAVSFLLMFMVTSFFWAVERVTTCHATRGAECFWQPWAADDRGRSIPAVHRDGDPAATDICDLIPK